MKYEIISFGAYADSDTDSIQLPVVVEGRYIGDDMVKILGSELLRVGCLDMSQGGFDPDFEYIFDLSTEVKVYLGDK